MESKKLEKPRENGTFSTVQGVMKPDEEDRGVFRNKRSTPHIEKKNNSPSYLQFPVHHQQ